MKKIITLLFLLMMSSTILKAQTEHLKFKGIPLEGPLDSFVQKLKDQGYEYIGAQDGNAVFTGTFAGMDNCIICVTCMGLDYRVTGAYVVSPEKNNWNDLISEYTVLKKLLSDKYGAPSDCIERFSDYEPSDMMKILSIREGSCSYQTSFEIDNGSIGLTLTKGLGTGAAVSEALVNYM